MERLNISDNWSERVCESLMRRREALIDKWTYDYGVIFKGMEYVFENTKNRKYFDYIKKSMDHFINEDGDILSYSPQEYNIDHINNGKTVLFLYRTTGENKYRKAAALLRSQLHNHPRTSEGAFWHKNIYPNQIWLDGLYMGAVFYAEYVGLFGDKSKFDDVINQFIICEKHSLDSETGLLYHAWDESKEMFWCNKETGCSENFWGRSMGWFVMALADVLDDIPQNHTQRGELIRMLNDRLEALERFVSTSGVWYQVIDKAGWKGNYPEASASCMIVYAMAKACINGYIDAGVWKSRVFRSFQGILDEFVLMTNEGLVNLNKNCQVAGLGNKERRDGSYAYYISEPIIVNDPKGVGGFIKAASMVERLLENDKSLPSVPSGEKL